jgi:hypothetical protein
MKTYRLDKSAFRWQSLEEADNHKQYWQQQSVAERLRVAWYLTAAAYNIPADSPPPMDKTHFVYRRR